MFRPEWLTGTHARYKNDTNVFTEWLAENAAKTGFALPSSVNRTELDSKPSKSTKAPTKPPLVRLTVRQLVKQAAHIIAQRPKVVVPRVIFLAARRAINARLKCANWFKKAAGNLTTTNRDLERQNNSHTHFVNHLRFMVKILEPNVSHEDQVNPTSVTPTNRYELLDFEDTAEDDVDVVTNAMAATQLGGTQDAPGMTSAATRESIDEAQLAFKVFCAMMDFDSIRQHIKHVWREHKAGRVDIITASVVTEIAFQFLEKIEEDTLCAEINGEPGIPMVHVAAIWTMYCEAYKVPLEYSVNHPLTELAERLCIPTYNILSTMVQCVSPNDNILSHMVHVTGTSAVTVAQVTHGAILSGLCGIKSTFRDNMTKRLQDLGCSRSEKKNGIIEKISIVFSVQILADIHEILKAEVGKIALRMRISLDLMKSMRQSYGRFLKSGVIPPKWRRETWTPEDDQDLRGLKGIIDDVLIESWATEKKADISNMPASSRPAEKLATSLVPYSHNPVMCGLAMLAGHLDDQFTALPSVDAWWAIIPVAHLYNALNHVGCLDLKWNSMENVIATYTPEHIFYGGRPSDVEDCHKKLRLAKGLAADMSLDASAVRTTGVKKTRPMRKLEGRISIFSRSLGQWMMPYFPWHEKVAGSDEIQAEGLLIPLMQRALDSLNKDKKASRPSTTSDEVPEIAFLKTVQEGFQKEIPGLKINLWGLNEDCIRILVSLHDAFLPLFLQAGLDGYSHKESSPLPHVAEDVLYVTAALGRFDVLPQAAQIIKTVLKVK